MSVRRTALFAALIACAHGKAVELTKENYQATIAGKNSFVRALPTPPAPGRPKLAQLADLTSLPCARRTRPAAAGQILRALVRALQGDGARVE